jgi:fructosamine-3-kinase
VLSLADQVESILGQRPARITPLSGGCIGQVSRIDLPDGRVLVAKSADAAGTLDIEGMMLRYLAEHSSLPVPDALFSSKHLLLTRFVPGESRFDSSAERHAAELLADLHSVAADRCGFSSETLIGPLPQPNPWTDSWIEFFRCFRLLPMATQAQEAGAISDRLANRINSLADRLDELLEEPTHPSLLHGDVWTTNVLARDGRITAFLDPSVYYGHPEIELAFITLFSTFGEAFFARYHQLRPIRAGFFEVRGDIYNLYPLLVHARLFGGGYANQVSVILDRIGC